MSQHIDTIFTDGAFRPQHPVDFTEGERVKLIVDSNAKPRGDLDDDLSDIDDLLDHEFMEECRRKQGKALPIEEIRRRLSAIPGSLADSIIQDREDRF
jgi:predicted DNA-binding antitoxin AbrB/MazE fold protein